MARILYSLLVVCLLPMAIVHLLWRSRRQPEYLAHWGERFGCLPPRPAGPVIWIHAVSVGETRAAQPLVAALRAHHPDHRIVMTHMTPTGRATSATLFGQDIDRLYLPYDTPWAAAAFLRHYRPAVGLVMETELWPNVIAAARRQGVPLLLVNARLSARSAARYAKFPALTAEALAGLAAIGAQSEDDAGRLRQLGGREVAVLGNMKFDVAVPPAQHRQAAAFRDRIGNRRVFLCASTREGEEAAVLDAWPAGEDALLVIVPRHPQRFDEVAALVAARGLTLQRRCDEAPVAAATRVWLGDSMGEMFAYYLAADVAFVGGSLLDYGSQNLIEACAAGVATIVGPSTYNFAEAARAALAAAAVVQVGSAQELVARAQGLMIDDDARKAIGERGTAFAARHGGATARTMALIERFIPAGR